MKFELLRETQEKDTFKKACHFNDYIHQKSFFLKKTCTDKL